MKKIHIASHSTCFSNRSHRHKPDSIKHLDRREKERKKRGSFFQPLSDLDLPQRQLKATLRKEDGNKMGSKTRPSAILEYPGVLVC